MDELAGSRAPEGASVTEILRGAGGKPGFLKTAEEKFRERQDERDGEPTPEQVRAMAQEIAAARHQAMSWRPACTPCVHANKLAAMKLSVVLVERGLKEGSPEWMGELHAATLAGQQAYQEGKDLPEGALPPVKPADMLIGGTGCCVGCFQAAPEPPDSNGQQMPAMPGIPGRSASGLIVG
jgi:hypothetical protein